MGKILVVDDDKEVRAVMKGVLELEGFQVYEAHNGLKAIRMFNNDRPDTVLLDLHMPGMGGMEVLSKLRMIDPSVPVVILTGFGGIPNALEAGKCGAHAFLEKSSEIEDIVLELKEAIEARQQAALLNPLSSQQLEALRLSACGMKRPEIAKTMGISKRTVKWHLLSAVKRLKAADEAHAVAIASQLGLIKVEIPK